MSEKKRNPLFDILNIICTKEYTWETLPEEYKLAYSQFMINRFLSSYDYLMPLLDEVTTKHLTDEQHFTLLYTWVKHTKHYFNYNAYKIDNKVDEDLITSIKKEYKVGTREAKRYNEVLTEPQREYIKKRWADYIAFMKNK
jgi:hypothetical protein